MRSSGPAAGGEEGRARWKAAVVGEGERGAGWRARQSRRRREGRRGTRGGRGVQGGFALWKGVAVREGVERGCAERVED